MKQMALASQAKPGSSYFDSNTGEWKTVPTTAEQTRLQRGVVGSEILKEAFPKLITAFSPYFGLEGKLKLAKDKYDVFLGGATPEQTKRIADYDHALTGGLIGGAEGLMGTYGLQSTNHALRETKKILEPHLLDSDATYQGRINNELTALAERQRIQSESMRTIPGYKGEDPDLKPELPLNIPNPQTLPQTNAQKKKLAAKQAQYYAENPEAKMAEEKLNNKAKKRRGVYDPQKGVVVWQ